MRAFLMHSLALLTRHPRYRPEYEELDGKLHWSNKVWVSNIFRLYEYFFGRGVGIRAEARYSSQYKNGDLYLNCEFYTLEALLSHIECSVRQLVNWLVKPQTLPIPRVAYVTLGILGLVFSYKATSFIPLFLLAIATDASATSTKQTASPITWNHTCTGSNLGIAIGMAMTSTSGFASVSGVTYNNAPASKGKGTQASAGAGDVLESSTWLLSAPVTGTNQVAATFTGGVSPTGGGISTSYSGVKQANALDGISGTTGSATGSQSIVTTTIKDNCWIFGIGINCAGTGPTITANQTTRGNLDITGGGSATVINVEDSNADQTPAGGKTLGFTLGAGGAERGWNMSFLAFRPAGSDVSLTTNNLRPRAFSPGVAR